MQTSILISFNEIKTVKIKSSFANFIALGYRKSEIESESTDVTSGMSTDEGEEKKKKKGKKLVKHKDMERERKGKGMLSELLPLYTLYERESITCRLNLRYVEVGGRLFEAGRLLPFSALRMGLCT
jgi:hypothetical protein